MDEVQDKNGQNTAQTMQAVAQRAISGLTDSLEPMTQSWTIVRRGLLRAQIEVLKGLLEATEHQLSALQTEPTIQEKIVVR